MSLLETTTIECPYCGERIELVIDCSIAAQEYVEDCAVCCRPISLQVTIGDEGVPQVEAHRDDD